MGGGRKGGWVAGVHPHLEQRDWGRLGPGRQTHSAMLQGLMDRQTVTCHGSRDTEVSLSAAEGRPLRSQPHLLQCRSCAAPQPAALRQAVAQGRTNREMLTTRESWSRPSTSSPVACTPTPARPCAAAAGSGPAGSNISIRTSLAEGEGGAEGASKGSARSTSGSSSCAGAGRRGGSAAASTARPGLLTCECEKLDTGASCARAPLTSSDTEATRERQKPPMYSCRLPGDPASGATAARHSHLEHHRAATGAAHVRLARMALCTLG
jgi:hypothetical protein